MHAKVFSIQIFQYFRRIPSRVPTEFYPDCSVQWKKLGEHGNVTKILVSHVSRKLPGYAGKSLSRISVILDPGVHQPMDLLHGYHNRRIYVAHMRIKRNPPGGMNAC